MEGSALRLRQAGSMAGTMPSRKRLGAKGAPGVLSLSPSGGKTRGEPAPGGTWGLRAATAAGRVPGEPRPANASDNTTTAEGASPKANPPSQDAPGTAEEPAGATPAQPRALPPPAGPPPVHAPRSLGGVEPQRAGRGGGARLFMRREPGGCRSCARLRHRRGTTRAGAEGGEAKARSRGGGGERRGRRAPAGVLLLFRTCAGRDTWRR